MRILVLAQSAGIGGIESSLASFLSHLSVRGDDVDLVFWRDTGPLRDTLPSNVAVLDIQTGAAKWIYKTGGIHHAMSFEGKRAKIRALAAIAVRKILEAFKKPWALLNSLPTEYDAAIAFRHQGYAAYYLIDKVAAKRKIMWFHHGEYLPSRMGHRVDASYFGRLDYVIAVSEWNGTVFATAFPDLAEKIRVIRTTVDPNQIRAMASAPIPDELLKEPGFTFVTASRLSPEKGIDLAVRTAALLKGRGLHFIWYVLGDGPERAHLDGLVTELDVQDVFILLGERPNPFPYMMLADIYVQTSRVEAYGLTIEEAKILGKPIVASNLPSALEVLNDGELGVLCDVEAAAFADAILSLAQDPVRRASLVKKLLSTKFDNTSPLKELDRILADY